MERERAVITIAGTVDCVVFQSEQTGFAVFELDTGAGLVTVVGEIPGIAAGEEVSLTGSYTTHPVHGHQFKAELCERHLPATAAAIYKYLCSGVIKGIGPATARRIVDYFGDHTLEILEQDPDKLAQVKGISSAKAQSICEQFGRLFGIRSVMLQLSRYDIDPAAAIRVWRMWGASAPDVIAQNPYLLCGEPVEVPFEKADAIAAGLGFAPADPRRLRAGILHVLAHNLRNGHTCLPLDKLLPTAAALLGVADDPEQAEQLAEELELAGEEGDVALDSFDGRRFAYLPRLYEAETYIAGRIGLMLMNTPPGGRSLRETEIAGLEKRLGISYHPLQKQAIRMALQNDVFILTGGPGTGKTTTLNAILELFEAAGEKVALAAPTGRAAKRMSEVTGREAKTIHRLLEVDFADPETGKRKFRRDEKNPLRFGAIILDEVSMVDTQLLHSLMKAMRLSCRLVLVGDPDQLPSVGAGNILRDLIDSEQVPMVHLSEIFRQARESVIVQNAHQIVRGESPSLTARDSDFFFLRSASYQQTADTVAQLCAQRLPAAYGFSPLWDIQVICPSRVGALGTVELNRMLQEHLNPADPNKAQTRYGQATFREGDKVMQVRNNYDIVWKREDGETGAGVFNGDIGIVELLDRPSQSLLIRYDDRVAEYNFDMLNEIEHAYAITVHKSQGSEFEAVVMPLMNYHQKLYYRNILYTAVTRAKKLLVMLGDPVTVERMVQNHRKVLRYTQLEHLLRHGAGEPDDPFGIGAGTRPGAAPSPDRSGVEFPEDGPGEPPETGNA